MVLDFSKNGRSELGFRFVHMILTTTVFVLIICPVQCDYFQSSKSCFQAFGSDHTEDDIQIKIYCDWEDSESNLIRRHCIFQDENQKFVNIARSSCGETIQAQIKYKICNKNQNHYFELNPEGTKIRFDNIDVSGLKAFETFWNSPIGPNQCKAGVIFRTIDTCQEESEFSVRAKGYYLDDNFSRLPKEDGYGKCNHYAQRLAKVGYIPERPSASPSESPSLRPSSIRHSLPTAKSPHSLHFEAPNDDPITAKFTFDVTYSISCVKEYVESAVVEVLVATSGYHSYQFSAGLHTTVEIHSCFDFRFTLRGSSDKLCATVTNEIFITEVPKETHDSSTESETTSENLSASDFSFKMKEKIDELVANQEFQDGLFNETESCKGHHSTTHTSQNITAKPKPPPEETPNLAHFSFEFTDDISFRSSCVEKIVNAMLNNALLKVICSPSGDDGKPCILNFHDIHADTKVREISNCQEDQSWFCGTSVHEVEASLDLGGNNYNMDLNHDDMERAVRIVIEGEMLRLSTSNDFLDALSGKNDGELC